MRARSEMNECIMTWAGWLVGWLAGLDWAGLEWAGIGVFE